MSTLHRCIRNIINTLKDLVGNWTFKQNDLQNQILTYYKNLFTTEDLLSITTHQDSNAHISYLLKG